MVGMKPGGGTIEIVLSMLNGIGLIELSFILSNSISTF